MIILILCLVSLLVLSLCSSNDDEGMQNADKMIIHYHITHCAGTKLLDIVDKNHFNPPGTRPWFYDFHNKSPKEVERMFLQPKWKWAEIEIPLPYKNIPWNSPHFHYTIILREPLSRAVANDGFMENFPETQNGTADYSNWIESKFCDNYLIRWIANRFDDFAITDKDLQVAKDNLKKFDVVLILERFPEEMKKLRTLGFEKWYPGPKKKRKSVREKIGEKSYQRLKEINIYDIQLYEFAKTLN